LLPLNPCSFSALFILASLYKDLILFKKTIVGLSKYRVGGDKIPMVVTLQSPLYLVKIWVWERFKKFATTTHVDQPRLSFFVQEA
jgi:hypothetical protein